MNQPPKEFTRVPAEAMRAFVTQLFLRGGMGAEQAELLGQISP